MYIVEKINEMDKNELIDYFIKSFLPIEINKNEMIQYFEKHIEDKDKEWKDKFYETYIYFIEEICNRHKRVHFISMTLDIDNDDLVNVILGGERIEDNQLEYFSINYNIFMVIFPVTKYWTGDYELIKLKS